jgi:hypothetical protein
MIKQNTIGRKPAYEVKLIYYYLENLSLTVKK